MTDYTVSYARRRTLCVYVRPDGTVEVRAPHGLSRGRIQAFVEEKAGWIEAKRAEALARRDQREGFLLGEGDPMTLLGREYRLAFAAPGESPGPDGDRLLLSGRTQEELRESLGEVCRSLARGYVLPRTRELAEGWGFSYAGASVTGARTRWGSCSGKNHLNFSLRLAHASPGAVDYVILHELAHTREHNHSPRYWRVVAGCMPDYQLRETELKELQRRLSLCGL